MKNHFIFVNDHSGSMGSLVNAAIKDYNSTQDAVASAAANEKLDTVVSVIGLGLYNLTNNDVKREHVFSNPNVLKPVTSWPTPGGHTPLYDAIGEAIKIAETAPDKEFDVSYVIFVTTDGGENSSATYYTSYNECKVRNKFTGVQIDLAAKIRQLQATGQYTFVLRVPESMVHADFVTSLGIPKDNIQGWSTTAAGMERSTQATKAAVQSFTTARAAGTLRSSNSFYTSVANVDTSSLTDISAKTSLYTVPQADNGILIRDFILTKRMEYLIGAAFYQLTKDEARVSPTKLILIRDKVTGKVYAGTEARKQLGLDTINNARLKPQHGNGQYDIFIQSEAWNRKLVGGTGVLYWAEKGRPRTQADLDKYAGQNKVAAPAVPVLASAPLPGQSSKSPIPVQKMTKVDHWMVDGRRVFNTYDTREEARIAGKRVGCPVRYVQDIRDFPGMSLVDNKRWFLFE